MAWTGPKTRTLYCLGCDHWHRFKMPMSGCACCHRTWHASGLCEYAGCKSSHRGAFGKTTAKARKE